MENYRITKDCEFKKGVRVRGVPCPCDGFKSITAKYFKTEIGFIPCEPTLVKVGNFEKI